MCSLTNQEIDRFKIYLYREERAQATISKYASDLKGFQSFVSIRQELSKETVLAYKEKLAATYAPASVNSKLAALNSYFDFSGHPELRVKPIKIQRKVFCAKEKELTKSEYLLLLSAAGHKKNQRLRLVIQAICATGIRVSELRFITVEAVKKGRTEVSSKGKIRTVFLTKKLCSVLMNYCQKTGRKSGPVFVTRNGNPLDRSNIWSDMKRLCRDAGVPQEKVFPHNLRHLFARSFYKESKDIAKLADLLGHSSIDTTRIYILASGEEHKRKVEHLGLVV